MASKLRECIRELGYTKVSFASKADISRPTLDKLLNGVDSHYIDLPEMDFLSKIFE